MIELQVLVLLILLPERASEEEKEEIEEMDVVYDHALFFAQLFHLK